ncbi:hypothetical protein EDF35_1931 [Rathayibacter sp. PhB151]|uniref:phage major capsid protein n=1 Tax=Rathayibacter sp. PhB151 TaxID=2485189 RepID=UPI001062A927|nr:hypothetical protein [Rathayibacter sp. PhB151]TDX78717.1 hypothetical protein EDF35_1931 [Rathayibacter sp. PhB151]
MNTYPFTASQVQNASATDVLAFIKSPTLLARRLGEILTAQQFIGNFLFSGRYAIQGGAIAVPSNEKFRTQRTAETVNAGAEYKLTPLSAEEWEIYTSQKRGLATEVTDEEVTRSLRQPLDDALTFLQTELVFDANDIALGVAQSAITQSVPGGAWTNGKQILKDAERIKARARALKLGISIDTVVLSGEQYAEVLPELLDILPDNSDLAITGSFPTVAGITWVSADDDDFTDPMFLDRRIFGGIARERIASPEYVAVGTDTGVEIASIREPKADKTRIQARNPHVPVVRVPQAGFRLTGTGA